MCPRSVAALPPVSKEVRDEALKRAHALAEGLFPHQVEGLAFLLGRRRAILADDMGLGKTRQSVLALTEAAPTGPWLVVTPASVKRNWLREILIVRPDDDIHVVGPDAPREAEYAGWTIINYDLLARHAEALAAVPWTGFIFDEAHYLKNYKSIRSKLARQIVDARPGTVLHCLTGTPLTNRPRDLFPLLQLVGHPMGKSFLSFAKRYCDARHNGFGWDTKGASNLEELRVQLHGVMLRRTKDEVLDLPPKIRSWVPVTVPDGTGRKQARRFLEMLLKPKKDYARLLAHLMKARQVIASAKVDTTIEFVRGAIEQGEKVLVFSGFEDPIDKISAAFEGECVVLTGKTESAIRQRIVDRFQRDPEVKVFVANIIAGGVGLNLTAARQVVFNDLDWVPANHWQAEDRAYRIGQTNVVNVTYFWAEQTVEEFVATVLSEKTKLIDAVIEGGPDAVPRDVLSELEDVFRTLSPGITALEDDGSGVDPVERLLREVSAAAKRNQVANRPEQSEGSAVKVAQLKPEAILALARALSGPTTQRYHATSASKPGKYYVLDVDGGDITCNCPGFEYRGSCVHARSLKAALTSGASLPEGFSAVP